MEFAILYAVCFTFSVLLSQSILVSANDNFQLNLLFQLTKDGEPVAKGEFGRIVAASVAVHHVNERNGIIADILSSDVATQCPIKFSYSIYDTEGTEERTVQYLVKHFAKTFENTGEIFIGPSHTVNAVSLNYIMENFQVPVISPEVTSSKLDSKEYFFRTVPSDKQRVEILVRFIRVKLGYKFVTFLYQESDYNRNFRNDIRECAKEFDLDVNFVFCSGTGNQDIKQALQEVKQAGLNIVVASFDVHLLFDVLYQASLFELTGKGRQWIFPDYISLSDLNQLYQSIASNATRKEQYSAVSRALNGTFMLNIVDDAAKKLKEEWVHFSKYLSEIKGKLSNISHRLGDDYFDETASLPNTRYGFYYDAVVLSAAVVFNNCEQVMNAMGMITDPPKVSRNQGGKGRRKKDRNSQQSLQQYYSDEKIGEMLRDTFKSTSFMGASGSVSLDMYGSRAVSDIRYEMQNIIIQQDVFGNCSCEYKSIASYANDTWNIDKTRIRYPPGDTIEQPEFKNFPPEERYHITRAAITVVCVFVAIVLLLWLFAFVFVVTTLNNPVMKASQPMFLLISLFGILLATISPIFFSMDDKDGHAPLYACQTTISLWSIGTTITAVSLQVKLYRIMRIFNNEKMAKVNLHTNLHYVYMGCVVLGNLVVVLVFSLFDPLQYNRYPLNKHPLYGYVYESYGTCESEHEILFFSIIFSFYFVLYLATGILAFRIRNSPADFQEAKWIWISILGTLQFSILAVPTYLALSNSDTSAKFCIVSLVIIMNSALLLTLLFVPKFIRIKSGTDKVKFEQ